jgi:hypothetical protein
MRSLWICLAAAAFSAAPAFAIPYFPPPTPVYEAPIDRALTNVAGMQNLEPAQRERVLGRLNLLAYARDDANFVYTRENDELNEPGSVPCISAPPGMVRGARDAPTPTFAPEDLCAVYTFNIGPPKELPDTIAGEISAAGRVRLEAAERHYARALQLDATNLRARLGRAYALDRLGRIDDARQELRRLVKLGLPLLAEPRSNWDDHAVLTETAEHLSHLATSSGDRRRVAALRARLQASQPIVYVTPIVVPLTDGAFETLIDDASPVAFDFAGTGDARAQGWLTPDAAWLVWDPNGRGDIRSGFDLIGARTWAVFWSDGFEALRALDDNRDGELTGAELGGLALWRDGDGDGVSDAGEVLPVGAHGVVGLAVSGEAERPGLLNAPGGVRLESGERRSLHDWTPGLRDGGPVT